MYLYFTIDTYFYGVNNLYLNNKNIIHFLVKAGGLYLAWTLLYHLFIEPDMRTDSMLILNLIFFADRILHIFNYEVFSSSTMIGITGTSGLIISPVCDGLDLFVLFSIFIVSFPGKAVHKLFFITTGILIIHVLNILRIVTLALIENHYPNALAFNHSYTFTLLMYLVIFGMWMVWVRKVKRGES